MRKLLSSVILVIVIVSIALSACYALGVFDDADITPVENQEYPTGKFTYSGEMKLGHFNGKGTIDFHNGDRLVGDFIDGRLDGEGVFYFSNEQYGIWLFAGVFEDGIIESGIFHLVNGETIEYKPGTSSNVLIGDNWQYDGLFSMNGQSGTGVFTFYDGSAYTGGFANGLADGKGTYTDSSGSIIYAGEFKEGLFDGHGSYYCSDGWSYEGSFKGGLFDGEGAIITDTATICGIWAEGVQIERYE